MMFSAVVILDVILITESLLLAFLLFTLRSENARAGRIMGIYMLINGVQFLLNIFGYLENYRGAVLEYYFIFPLMLCNIPLLYFYIFRLTEDGFRFRLLYILHFLPAVLILAVNLYTFGSFDYDAQKQIISGTYQNINNSPNLILFINTYRTANLIYNIQSIAYPLVMIYLLVRHGKNILHFFSYRENISLSWVRYFIAAFVLYSGWEVIIYYTDIYIQSIETTYSVTIAFTTFLGYFGLKQTDIYSGAVKSGVPGLTYIAETGDSGPPLTADEKNRSENDTDTVVEISGKRKYFISEELRRDILQRLESLMEKEKLFFKSDLSLEELAIRLNINKNYLSRIINEDYGRNFFYFINQYRLEEAKRMLLDSEFDTLSIEGIATTVGFNSKSTFNPAFKKYTGLTPSEYKKVYMK